MKKACIVGCGAISGVHANALSKVSEAELYAVCDINKERADRLSKKYNTKVYYDFSDVISDKNVESVHICTPHYLHVSMCEEALCAGKYVVLEKPAAISKSELLRLKALDEKYPGKLCFVLQNRNNVCVRKLKKLVETEDNGKMLGAKAFVTWKRNAEYYAKDEWRGKWETEGGGVLINQTVHTLDLLDWICGPIQTVKASISTKVLDGIIEVEDTADAVFELENGARAFFYVTNNYFVDSPVNIEINFEKVTYRYADSYLYRIVKGKAPEVISGETIDVNWKSYWGDGHISVIGDFYDNIAGKGNAYLTLKDGEHSQKVLFAMYESAKNESLKIKIK